MLKYKRLFLYATIVTKLLVLMTIGFSTAEFINASNSVYLSERIVDVSHKVIVTILGAESAQRGFLITGEEDYLTPYDYAVANLDYQLNDLNLSSTAAGTEYPQVSSITSLAHAKMDELYDSIKLRKTKSFEASQELVKKDIGQRLMNQLESQLGQVIEEERIRTEYLEKIIRWTGFIIIGGLIAFSVLAIITVVVAKSAYSNPTDPDNDPAI